MGLVVPALAAMSVGFAAGAVALRVNGVVALRAGFAPRPARSRRRFRRLAARTGSAGRLQRLARSPLLTRRLATSGWAVSVEELVGVKVLLGAGTCLVVLLAPVPGPVLSPILGAVAFRVPDLILAGAARGRAAAADREIPQLLDLLAAASSAGLSGPLALRRAVEATRGPLAEELGAVLRAVDLGGRWRDELRKASDRLELPDLRRAVAALSRTETLGTSLSEAMRELAAQVREARRAAAGERARKAPVKMLFPLVFLVLPAFLLLTVVPVLLTTLKSIR